MRPTFRNLMNVVVPLLTGAFGSAPLAAITFPAGGLRPDAPADLAPHPQAAKNYNELWTYQFQFDNGLQVQLNFTRANFGTFKDPVCGSDLAVLGFKAHNYFVAREYPVKNFAFDTAKARLQVHENIYFEGAPPLQHRVYFSTRKKDVDYFLDLRFDEMIPGAVWGNGITHLSNAEVGLFIHIPQAKVTGRVAINGDTLAVQGFGWMDHTYQTQFATQIMDAGYRYVSPPTAAHSVEGGYFFQSGEGVFGYGIREENGQLVLLRPKDIKVEDQTQFGGVNLAHTLKFNFVDSPGTRFIRSQDRQKTSAFQELSWIEKKGAKYFLGGEIFSFRGMGTVGDSLPALFSFTLVRR